MLVNIYTKPNCPACSQTKRLMKKLNIEFTEAPITNETLTFARKRGLAEAPIVVTYRTGDTIDTAKAWSGFRSDHIKKLSKEQ